MLNLLKANSELNSPAKQTLRKCASKISKLKLAKVKTLASSNSANITSPQKALSNLESVFSDCFFPLAPRKPLHNSVLSKGKSGYYFHLK